MEEWTPGGKEKGRDRGLEGRKVGGRERERGGKSERREREREGGRGGERGEKRKQGIYRILCFIQSCLL